MFWSFGQSRHPLAIFVGSCWWLSLAAASSDPAVWQAILPLHVGFSHSEFVAVDAICKHANTLSLSVAP